MAQVVHCAIAGKLHCLPRDRGHGRRNRQQFSASEGELYEADDCRALGEADKEQD